MKRLLAFIKTMKLQDITNIILILGVIIALFQLNTNKNIESAKLMIEFNNQLRNSQFNYAKYLFAVDNNLPMLKPKGSFTNIQLDNFLVEWELLNLMRERNLIDDKMAYNAFAYEVEATWCNKDIQKFIMDSRKTDDSPDLYGGFEELAKYYLKKDKLSLSCEKLKISPISSK